MFFSPSPPPLPFLSLSFLSLFSLSLSLSHFTPGFLTITMWIVGIHIKPPFVGSVTADLFIVTDTFPSCFESWVCVVDPVWNFRVCGTAFRILRSLFFRFHFSETGCSLYHSVFLSLSWSPDLRVYPDTVSIACIWDLGVDHKFLLFIFSSKRWI